MRWTLLLALFPTLALAQSSASRPEDLGTVTGHITCADTQRPARFAQVSLITTQITNDEAQAIGPFGPAAVGSVHTDLTGSYTIPSVPPGRYYLRVDLYGYATPLQQFTPAELKAPTPEIQQRIQHDLQLVTVASNATVQADMTIHRSGSITGRIMYDDGSPVITTGIAYARRDTSGKFGEVTHIGYVTGGHGEYEIVSLSPGEYIVQVTLNATEQHMELMSYGDGKAINRLVETSVLSLPVYSGNVFRPQDAAIIKVEDGQETPDINITIPISRLHELSGTLLAKDGHVINSGNVHLLFADTQEELMAESAHEDGTFHFPYVPEGSYIISVTNALDTTLVEAPDSRIPGSGTNTFRQATHIYGTLQQPLTVITDIQSLNLTVPNQSNATASSH